MCIFVKNGDFYTANRLPIYSRSHSKFYMQNFETVVHTSDFCTLNIDFYPFVTSVLLIFVKILPSKDINKEGDFI